MSAYIYCPECREECLDVDTYTCSACGYYPERKLEKRVAELETELRDRLTDPVTVERVARFLWAESETLSWGHDEDTVKRYMERARALLAAANME